MVTGFFLPIGIGGEWFATNDLESVTTDFLFLGKASESRLSFGRGRKSKTPRFY